MASVMAKTWECACRFNTIPFMMCHGRGENARCHYSLCSEKTTHTDYLQMLLLPMKKSPLLKMKTTYLVVQCVKLNLPSSQFTWFPTNLAERMDMIQFPNGKNNISQFINHFIDVVFLLEYWSGSGQQLESPGSCLRQFHTQPFNYI